MSLGGRAQQRAAMTFFGLFVLFVVAWLGVRHERRGHESETIRLLAEQVAYRFGREVEIHLALATMVKSRLQDGEAIDQERFRETVSHVQHSFSSIAAIAFLTPEMTVRWMMPEGNFFLGGLPLFDQPMQHELMMRSFLEKKTVISPPLQGDQGSVLLTAYIPVSSQGRFVGYLSPVLRLDVLFQSLLNPGFLHSYVVRVLDQASGNIIYRNTTDEKNADFSDAPIFVAGRHFVVQLASSRSDSWLLPIVILSCAFLASLLSAMLVYQRTWHGIEMYRQRARFKEMADMLPEMMVLELRNDPVQRWPISYMNKAARRALSSGNGNTEDQGGLSLFDVASEQSYDALDQKLGELRHIGEPQQDGALVLRLADIQLYRANAAATFPAEIVVRAILNKENNEVVGFQCVIRDKTADIEGQLKLEQAATHDALTGLPNRSLFYDRLEQAIGRARRMGSRLAVLFCDLDKFKQVNDTLGHHAGDDLLRQVARRMREAVRETDTVARLAGDEFVFIVEGLSGSADVWPAVDACCSKIIDHASGSYVIGDGHNTVHIGLSIGVSIFPDHGDSADELLIKADHSMYRAKACGGNVFRMDVILLSDAPAPSSSQ